MSEQLSCLFCGRTGKDKKLTILGITGLDTVLACSLQRNDDLLSRIKTNGPNAVHEKCRLSYINPLNIAKSAALKSSVDNVLNSENDLVQERVEVSDHSLFNFSKLCFICAKNCVKSTNFNKVHKIEVESSIRDNILQACCHGNDVLSNEVAQRIAAVDLFSVGAKYHQSCFIKLLNISASSIPDHELSVAGVQQVATLPAWIIDGGTIPVNNHHDCLRHVAMNNGMEIVNTISGGSCFFDAVRQGALQFGFVRSVEELRVAAALELKIHSQQYRPLYIVEDHGQFVQAPTYDLFVDRTENGGEWATAMTVAAMAVAIGIPIKVISTATNASGLITAYQIDNTEGVNYSNEMIVVGYNSATAHYVGFRSVNFNRFLQVEQDLSAEFQKISCFNPPTMISNDNDEDMFCGNIAFDDDHDDDDEVNMSNFGTTFPNEETEFVFNTHPQPPPYSSMDFSTSPLLSEEDDNIFPEPVSAPVFDNFSSMCTCNELPKLSQD